MHIVKTGRQWRMLPKDFPPHNTVFYYFRKRKREGVFEELADTLHVIVRRQAGREDTPGVGIIGSRSIRSSHHVASDRGIDGYKKVKGRKEHIVVDTLGLPTGVVVHEANITRQRGRAYRHRRHARMLPAPEMILADGGYKGQRLVDTVRRRLGAEFTVALRPDGSAKKFNVLPLRWIDERSLSWIESFRRIAMDYELYSDTGEAMVKSRESTVRRTIKALSGHSLIYESTSSSRCLSPLPQHFHYNLTS